MVPRVNGVRRGVIAVLCIVLGPALGLLVGAPPAAATVTTLCKTYTGCTLLGMSDAGYGAANKTMYWRMYTGHNCTNYAAYRMIKAGMPNVRPWSGSGNATNWGVAMSSITNSTPTVGSIAWWKAGVKPAGSAGHVAYVEKVVSANEIIVSQDSWGGEFSWARVTRTSSGWPSGFIHFHDPAPVVPQQPTPTTPAPTTPPPTPTPPPPAPTTTPATPTLAKPSLRGTAKPGQSLEVQLPATPKGLTASVQWLRNDTPVRGATSRTYAVGAADVGARIRAEVRYAGSGFTTQTASTGATALIRVPAQVKVSTTPGRRHFSFTAGVTGYQGAPVDGRLQVRRHGHLLKTVRIHDGVAQGTVRRQRPGTRAYRFRAQLTSKTTRGVATTRVQVRRR